MPNRVLRDYTDSRVFDSLDWLTECLFVRLIVKADDFGRFSADPVLIKSLVFPTKDGLRSSDISARLTACEKAGLIKTYQVNGKPFLEIVNFNQPLKKLIAKLPVPPWDSSSRAHTCAVCVCAIETESETESETETKKTSKKKFSEIEALPQELQPAFEQWVEVWESYQGKRMHRATVSKNVEELIKIRTEDRLELLNKAIRGCWKAIHPSNPHWGQETNNQSNDEPQKTSRKWGIPV